MELVFAWNIDLGCTIKFNSNIRIYTILIYIGLKYINPNTFMHLAEMLQITLKESYVVRIGNSVCFPFHE